MSGAAQREPGPLAELLPRLAPLGWGVAAAALAPALGAPLLIAASLALMAALAAAPRLGRLPARFAAESALSAPLWALAGYAALLALEAEPQQCAAALLAAGAGSAAGRAIGWRCEAARRAPGPARTELGAAGLAATTAASALACAPWLGLGPEVAPSVALSAGLAGAALAALAPPALDLLLLPLATALILRLCESWDAPRALWHLAELTGALLLCAGAVRWIWLSARGALGTYLVGVLCAMAAGWGLVALLLVFFASSSALSRLRPERFVQDDAQHGRGLRQVLAFGLVPTAAALAHALWGGAGWLGAAAASVAAACADTFATEIGRHSRRAPVGITSGRPVPAGTSGGVTALGLLGSALGAGAIAASAVALGLAPLGQAPLLAAVGLAASLLDSLLGAHAQEFFECPHCGARGENRPTCAQARRVRGLPGVSNEAVNLAISACAAAAFHLGSRWL